jgi:hypothetical protein
MNNLAITGDELRINGFLSASKPEMLDFSSIPVINPEIWYFRRFKKGYVNLTISKPHYRSMVHPFTIRP